LNIFSPPPSANSRTESFITDFETIGIVALILFLDVQCLIFQLKKKVRFYL
jgi:hypothetical protein